MSKQNSIGKPSIVNVRRVQGLSYCDERSVKKALTYGPEKIRGIAGERIAAAMRELGLVALNVPHI